MTRLIILPEPDMPKLMRFASCVALALSWLPASAATKCVHNATELQNYLEFYLS